MRGNRSFLSSPNAWLIAALTAGLIVLVAAGAIGARRAQVSEVAAGPSGSSASSGDATGQGPEATARAGQTATPGPGAGQTGATGTTTTVTGGTRRTTTGQSRTSGGGTSTGGTGAGTTTGSREGVAADYFKFGVHAPLTLDGAPLNLAEDPITGFKGYITYVNRQGGVNGRKIRLFLTDDRYTTDGGAQARDKLVREIKPFFISGTLGVDQIAIVAKSAGDSKIPYMAVGGPEPEWKTIGMFQVGSSYDQYTDMLAKWICSQGQAYVGEPLRIGITTLDSPYIRPVEQRFVDRLKNYCGVVVDSAARGYVQKPTQQTQYAQQYILFSGSYGGQSVNLMIPLQDPVTTSRQVAEWKAQPKKPKKWTFANFAHDGDTTLALVGAEWTGVRGLSGACYYQYERAFDPTVCANMKGAHDEWLALGHVDYDQNAGGDVGGHASYDYTQANWDTDGSGGSSGYQLVHFWLAAMRATGADPTREKFVAALQAYQSYADLITSPITFRASTNIMHGAERMSVLEGQSNLKFKQISVGLLDHF